MYFTYAKSKIFIMHDPFKQSHQKCTNIIKFKTVFKSGGWWTNELKYYIVFTEVMTTEHFYFYVGITCEVDELPVANILSILSNFFLVVKKDKLKKNHS